MRRRIKTLIGALLLCITAAVAIPFSHVEAKSASASDFQMKGDTLVKYTGTASAVSIPTSVKHIGKEAFLRHTELVKVEIPAYVETIDYNAFNGCSSLETISIPDTVTSVGNGAFGGCTSLKSVYLGKKLKKLGTGMFADCSSLETVRISKDNKEFTYDSGVIYSKDKKIIYNMLPGYETETYTMPSSVEEIKSNAFWGCQNLKKVEVGRNVKNISDYAFSNCSNLEKVIFPYSLYSIGLKAFADCINLGETEIPISVARIHETAFDGCPKLKILAEEGSRAAEFEAKRDKSNVAQTEYEDIPTSEEGTEGGENQTDGQSGAAGENGTSDGASASDGNMLGQTAIVGGNAVVFIDNSQSKVLSGNIRPDTGNGKNNGVVGTEVMETAGGFAKYTIVNNNKIASQAYYNNSSLTEYKMPENITEIGDFSFARSGLTSVIIPEKVTKIGYGAFYHCDNLSEIRIPASVTEIEPAAFAETAWMKKRMTDRNNPFTIVGDGILIAYSGMYSKVEIPEGVKQIGAEVFKDNRRIVSVELPDSLTVIGEDAFAGCSSLTAVSGGSNVKQIKDRAFAGCPLKTIKIPESVDTIGLKAFDMSEAGQEEGAGNAVFLGRQLPTVSYEKTATRLVNESYRDAVFKEVGVAVVDDSISAADIRGTVLDHNMGGFQGLICSVEQPARGETPGRLRIKYWVMPESKAVYAALPETVTVYGKTYEFSYNEEETPVCLAEEETESADEEGTVSVEVNSNTLPAAPAPTAEIEGSKEDYILRISDNSTDGSAMISAYRKATAGRSMKSLQVYDISLYDARRMMPISRLGRQKMTITLPKPNGIRAENIQVVCMDEDGQLEKVESRLVTVNGQKCVQFEASHFSVYGIYN